ncbi:MAG: PqqD family protein [Desulfobacterales bacterium]|nr:PqqD family protein [Desulfobacterales bacterium]
MLSRKKKSGLPSREDALECTPIKNDRVEESRSENGELQLSYPVTARPWLAGFFRRMGRKSEGTYLKKLQLDALGTEVWELLDGGTRVRDVIRQFASRHHLQQREAQLSVTRFLRELGKRGLIGLR